MGSMRVYIGSMRGLHWASEGLHWVCEGLHWVYEGLHWVYEGLHGVYSESVGSPSPVLSSLDHPQPSLLLTMDQTLDSHHNTFSPESAFASKPQRGSDEVRDQILARLSRDKGRARGMLFYLAYL